ncbi:THUMP domain-containing class I SAM-dependent RNA methyltransferase [Paracoccus aerodenitrificans]|uniref:THUMP domain-containing class I SAM-dependent RNA methyltransferase n=1 Tax=Paracoccus aerodenitrificans TaxID=3017781 RepID=UPI0022F01BED|nr:class I SAM-dependent RNA methyltransferase [Paracoccus aerodenitrificans]WBU65756.1 class I SAM-dependent RNA methyltransferase [Paracoccus aerodenitrificans]
MSDFGIFLVATPGLEKPLADEARELGFADPVIVPGGVETRGNWPEIWRANLTLRCATRVLVRFAEFRAMHLAQLDKRARKLPWADILRPDLPVRVEASCRKSRIYHAGAAAQRIERAIREELGAPISKDAITVIKLRIEDDLAVISLDSSGESLHKRGYKEAVAKAPMRETMAAAFLRECGFTEEEPVFDPMCGSGTFMIEAAERSAGLLPGRGRGFAFEQFASFDPDIWARMKSETAPVVPACRFGGADRDPGAVRMSQANAERASVAEWCSFAQGAVEDAMPPSGPPGLVIINPPYGARVGNKGPLFALHARMGEVLRSRFQGWRVGIVTSEPGLAKATALPFKPPGPIVAHGGLKIRLYQTGPL